MSAQVYGRAFHLAGSSCFWVDGVVAAKARSLSGSEVAHLRMRNSTDFNIGGLKLAHTRMRQAIRVLEHACRITARLVSSTSTTTKTGRLAKELEGYVKRLKRLEDQGRTEEFYQVLQNAQMKLINLACKLLC